MTPEQLREAADRLEREAQLHLADEPGDQLALDMLALVADYRVACEDREVLRLIESLPAHKQLVANARLRAAAIASVVQVARKETQR